MIASFFALPLSWCYYQAFPILRFWNIKLLMYFGIGKSSYSCTRVLESWATPIFGYYHTELLLYSGIVMPSYSLVDQGCAPFRWQLWLYSYMGMRLNHPFTLVMWSVIYLWPLRLIPQSAILILLFWRLRFFPTFVVAGVIRLFPTFGLSSSF